MAVTAMQYPSEGSVGARFQRARLNDWVDFYRKPGALQTRPYGVGPAGPSISEGGKQFAFPPLLSLRKEGPGSLFLDLFAQPLPEIFEETFVNDVADKGCLTFGS